MNWNFENISKQISEKIGIYNVVDEYISLKKKGQDYVGLCPFHEDKNPSLLVSEKKQIFKCFSCGTGGGTVKFVMLYENLSFFKALKKISQTHNIVFENINFEEKTRDENEIKLLEIVQEAHTFYQSKMLNPPLELRKYLNKRKISPKIVRKYEIGWAPAKNDELYQYLQKKGFDKADIFATELVNLFDKEKKVKDYFFKRIIFTLKNMENEIVGFSGREIENFSKSKFLISRETSFFKKNEILFNLSFVNAHFKALTQIYLTEGFLDAIRLTEVNLPAVAILGTTLTKKQVQQLKERYKKIVIVPDGDEPGKISALQSALMLKKENFEVLIWNHNTNLDPDELIQSQPEIIQEKEKNFLSPENFILEKYKNLNKEENLNKIDQELKLFWPYTSYINKYRILKNIEKKFNFPLDVLIKQWPLENEKTNNEEIKKIESSPKNKIISWEKALIWAAINLSTTIEWMKKIPGRFKSEVFQNKIWPLTQKWNAEYGNNLFQKQKDSSKNRILILKWTEENEDNLCEKNNFFDKIKSQRTENDEILNLFKICFNDSDFSNAINQKKINLEKFQKDLLLHWHKGYLNTEESERIKKEKIPDLFKLKKKRELKKKIYDKKIDSIAHYFSNKKNNSNIQQ